MIRCLLLLLCLACAPVFAATPDRAQVREWLQAKDPRAAAAVAALVKAFPQDGEVRVLQTRLLLQQGKQAEAVKAAERAVDLAPELAQAHYWLGNAYGSRIGQVGMLAQAMMAPKLRDAFKRSIELDADLHEARVSLAEYYLQAPAIAGGSVEAAKAQAAELARRDPPRGHYVSGRIAQTEGRADAAADAYLAAYRARPENAGYRMAAGVALQETRRWAPAFAHFEAWTAEDPAHAGAWYQFGRTSALSGQRLDAGADAYRRFLALPQAPGQPEHKHGWYRLGQIQAKAGDTAAARASLQRALKADPDFAEARAELAKLD